MMQELSGLLIFFPVLLVSIILHEYAHARVAVAQGDPTPAQLGRVTLNPLPHIDPVGSLIVPAALWIMSAGFLFGWARPVPVVPRNFRNYRRGDLLVSLAGVGANFLLAVCFILLAVVFAHLERNLAGGAAAAVGDLDRMVRFGLWFNILLGFFNLLPIPPMDGSRVLYHLLPPALGARYREVGKYGMLLLFAAFFIPGMLGILLWPVGALTSLANDLIAWLT
jgi:Zn-dependent protease